MADHRRKTGPCGWLDIGGIGNPRSKGAEETNCAKNGKAQRKGRGAPV